MKKYYRIMLGRGSKYAADCYKNNYIGVDFEINEDLEGKLPENWRDFNKKYIPVYLEGHPGKAKVSAGLACGALWTLAKGIKVDDIVLCPDGSGSYYVGEVLGPYSYHPETSLPHRRPVKWYTKGIERSDMSKPLQNSTGSIGTMSNVSSYGEEIESLIAGNRPPTIISTDESIEDPTGFALEKHLEDFLVQNWNNTPLGKKYNIYEEEGELVGQQFQSDTGPMDILAISKDKKELLVVELKKGKASDTVVGQVQRYMGYVLEELAEDDQIVKGVIIAPEEDIRIRRALKVTTNIDFFTYRVDFRLIKGENE